MRILHCININILVVANYTSRLHCVLYLAEFYPDICLASIEFRQTCANAIVSCSPSSLGPANLISSSTEDSPPTNCNRLIIKQPYHSTCVNRNRTNKNKNKTNK
jgi:hypothetical protein